MSGDDSEFEESAREVAQAIDRSVAKLVSGESTVGVAFSGGLDSSIVAACASRKVRVVGCSGYSEGSGERARARDGASALGIELVATQLTRENVAEALGELDLPFVPTLMDRSLWSLYYLVSRSAREGGIRVMLLGQLADELFGGYAKYAEALRVGGGGAAAAMMMEDLGEYPRRGKVRDVRACGRWLEPRFPFEAKEIVDLALGLPVEFKIREGVRKAVLRRAATDLGVPDALVGAGKKAAQYSSGVQKIVAGSPF